MSIEVVLEQTAMEIAATLNTSDATVIRAIQALGFAGLRDLNALWKQWLRSSPLVPAKDVYDGE